MKKNLILAANAVVVFAALLCVWQAAVWVLHIPPYMLPPPVNVGRAIANRFPELWASFWISGEAAAAGLAGSIVGGLLIALIFARLPWLRRMLFPYTILLQTVPIVAIAPLILMWAGQGLFAVALVTFIICLAPIIANATQGLISVDTNLLQLFLMHNASQGQILRKLRLPHSLPYLFVGIRISSGIAVIGAITGELVRRIHPRRSRRPWLLYPVCHGATPDGLSFRSGFCRNDTRIFIFLYRHVFRVAVSSQVARVSTFRRQRILR